MLWFMLVIVISPAVVAAQAATCDSELLDFALETLGETCAGLDRNTACYGNNAITVTFVPNVEPTPFTVPSDQLPLASLDTLVTADYDPALAEWGIAVMNVQANLPGTLPGQGVVMMVIGGAEITNDSPDAQPMQAFTFRSGVGQGGCEAAPALLAVRSPEDVTVELTMNGLDFSLGSTMFLLDNGDDTFTVVLTEGTFTLADGTTVSAGEALDLIVDPATNVITSYGTPRAATPEEQGLGGTITPLLETVVPPQALYTVQPGDNLFRIALNNDTCVSALARANGIPQSQVRNVAVGRVLVIPDDTGCGALVNDIAPPPGAAVPPATTDTNTDTNTEVVTVDCSGFGVQSPVSGLAYNAQTFFWSGVDAASYYSLTLNEAGSLVASAAVEAPTTSATLDLSDFDRTVNTYTWSVTAFAADGTALCSATSPAMQRSWGEPEQDNDGDDKYGSVIPNDAITVQHTDTAQQRQGALMGASLMLTVGGVFAFGLLGVRRQD